MMLLAGRQREGVMHVKPRPYKLLCMIGYKRDGRVCTCLALGGDTGDAYVSMPASSTDLYKSGTGISILDNTTSLLGTGR